MVSREGDLSLEGYVKTGSTVNIAALLRLYTGTHTGKIHVLHGRKKEHLFSTYAINVTNCSIMVPLLVFMLEFFFRNLKNVTFLWS